MFAFCLGLLACNAVALLKAALRAVHGEEVVSGQLSAYYLVLEIRQTYAGMMVALPLPRWSVFEEFGDAQLGAGAQRDRKPGSDPPLSQDAAWSQETTAPTKALQEWRALRHGKDYCRAAKSVTLEGLALGAKDVTTREKAAQTLSGIGDAAAEASPALSQALRDGNADVRLAVAKALWSITKETREVVPALAHLLVRKWSPGPEGGESRRIFLLAVIESLGRIGPPAQVAVPALLDKTGDKNRHIRESAIRALRQIGPEAA